MLIQQHPNADVKTCPFNARHVVSAVKLAYHMQRCPDKAILMPGLKHQAQLEREQETGVRYGGDCSVPSYDSWQPPPCTENWDDEVDDSRVYFHGQHNTPNDTLYQRY